MKFILGTKENMAEYFTEEGRVFPVTIVSVLPNTVTRIFEKSKDGYDAVQVGAGVAKEKHVNKAERGAMKGAFYKTLKEFRIKTDKSNTLKEGDILDVSTFVEGDKLQVSATSKGKGFQGVVKRHGFHGGPRSHGQKHSEREAGSIGGGLRTHVPKGMRMAGRMGSDRITQKNLKVVFVDKENNLLLIKGAIPGVRGGLVEIISK
ncbi:MAG: 50S ribosomal protein L3 [bacterium]|nr:50S ribosomal protein L3 [bacterium]